MFFSFGRDSRPSGEVCRTMLSLREMPLSRILRIRTAFFALFAILAVSFFFR